MQMAPKLIGYASSFKEKRKALASCFFFFNQKALVRFIRAKSCRGTVFKLFVCLHLCFLGTVSMMMLRSSPMPRRTARC